MQGLKNFGRRLGVVSLTASLLLTGVNVLAEDPIDAAIQEEERPNIVFVFTDQHRRQAMGFWQKDEYKDYLMGTSDPVVTPNLDQLADEGVVLTQAYSTYPVCSPFRAMLFSGMYPEDNGVWQNCSPTRDDALTDHIDTFTDVLANHNYNVGYVGKWHLEAPRADFDKQGNYIGDDPAYQGDRYFPDGSPSSNTSCWDGLIPQARQRQIDYLYAYNTWDVFRGNSSMNVLKKPHYWDKDYNRITVPDGVWSPEFETDLALKYINNEDNVRDAQEPYCLFLSYNPPHTPYGSREDTDKEAYDTYYSETVQPDINKLINRPNVPQSKLQDSKYQENARVYFSHITGIDRQFGRIMEAVKQSGQEDNTIIVFTADHGEMMGSHNLMAKNVVYEESTGIPFLIKYPQKLQHKIDNLLMTGVDIMPTILSLAGIPIPDTVQGTDYSEVLMGKSDNRPESALFNRPDIKGVRTDRYVMTIKKGDENNYKEPVLYDLQTDPYQQNNLSFNAIPEADLLMLRRELGYWLCRSNDPWYTQKLYSDFIIYPDMEGPQMIKPIPVVTEESAVSIHSDDFNIDPSISYEADKVLPKTKWTVSPEAATNDASAILRGDQSNAYLELFSKNNTQAYIGKSNLNLEGVTRITAKVRFSGEDSNESISRFSAIDRSGSAARFLTVFETTYENGKAIMNILPFAGQEKIELLKDKWYPIELGFHSQEKILTVKINNVEKTCYISNTDDGKNANDLSFSKMEARFRNYAGKAQSTIMGIDDVNISKVSVKTNHTGISFVDENDQWIDNPLGMENVTTKFSFYNTMSKDVTCPVLIARYDEAGALKNIRIEKLDLKANSKETILKQIDFSNVGEKEKVKIFVFYSYESLAPVTEGWSSGL